MNASWHKAATRFEALKPRERMMVWAAGAVVIVWIGFHFIIDQELIRNKRLSTELLGQRTALAQFQLQTSELMRAVGQDPNAAGRGRIEALTAKRAQFDADLRGIQDGLVPPDSMARVLEQMLSRHAGVRLLRLRTLPVSALAQPAGQAGGSPATKNPVYKHGIEVTVEGGFLDLLRYQAKLEKLPWRMFFARSSVNAIDYPRVTMTVTLYTLSLEEAWLVV